MAIPNIKRFRPFCPTCNASYTVMAVLPKDANVDAFLADAVTRHDHTLAFLHGSQEFGEPAIGVRGRDS